MSAALRVAPIGVVHTAYREKSSTPVQTALNPADMGRVRITELHEDGFDFAGVDMIDGTPLLDVKPWAAPLDLPHHHSLATSVRSGWFDDVDLSGPHTPESLRSRRNT